MKTKEIRRRILHKKPELVLGPNDFVSTGSTMLNLACTDHPDRGFAKGHYYLVVGTSRSGKTWLSLSCLAEAANNKNFDEHLFVYNNVERGALMNIPRFFGKKVAKRLKVTHSYRIEDFYDHFDKVINRGVPVIYILDSMDALTSEQEIKTFSKQRKAREGEEKTAGSYGDGKAKINSQNLRRAINPLEKSGSILIIINQTRDKLGSFVGGKTHSGGNALRFYATLELWSDIKTQIKKTYKGKPRLQGVLCTLRVRKNRITGKDRIIEMPIYNTYGMDDIGSCIEYLIAEKHWKGSKGNVEAPEFDFSGRQSSLIKLISNKGMERDLGMIAADVWKEIEDAVAIKRKPRYV